MYKRQTHYKENFNFSGTEGHFSLNDFSFPVQFLESSKHYEKIKEDLIISNIGFILCCSPFKGEYIDWDYYSDLWTPKEMLSSCIDEYDMVTTIIRYLTTKLHHSNKIIEKLYT